jgi:adenine-specific DNA-methyltransferase
VILDFFAGSGTTFHATALLNASDAGSRQTILVTNNEVKEDVSRAFARGHTFPGDEKYEQSGVSEAVAWPRCRAVVTGQRPDDKPVEGAHLDGREYSEGFDENIEYFRLDFLDPDEVARGDAFKAILPIV